MNQMNLRYIRRVKSLRTGLAVASWAILLAGFVLTQSA